MMEKEVRLLLEEDRLSGLEKPGEVQDGARAAHRTYVKVSAASSVNRT